CEPIMTATPFRQRGPVRALRGGVAPSRWCGNPTTARAGASRGRKLGARLGAGGAGAGRARPSPQGGIPPPPPAESVGPGSVHSCPDRPDDRPPGTGKTMLARRLPTILPPLGLTEALEVSSAWSVAWTPPARGADDGAALPGSSPHHLRCRPHRR